MQLKKLRIFGYGDSPQELTGIIGALNERRANSRRFMGSFKDPDRVGSEFNLERDSFSDDTNGVSDDHSGHHSDDESEYDSNDKSNDNSNEESKFDYVDDFMGEIGMQINSNSIERPAKSSVPQDRMSRVRRFMEESLEFSLQEFEDAVLSVGWTRARAVTLLRSFMDSGEVYSPRKGFFRYVPGDLP